MIMNIKVNVMFTISAVVLFFLGLGLTFMTSFIHGMIGLEPNPASLHFAKAAGGAMLGFAAMAWLSRNSVPSQARNGLVLGLTLLYLLTGIEYVRSIMVGSLQFMGWIMAGMWLLLFVFMALAGRASMTES
jgi:hypothetical protein